MLRLRIMESSTGKKRYTYWVPVCFCTMVSREEDRSHAVSVSSFTMCWIRHHNVVRIDIPTSKDNDIFDGMCEWIQSRAIFHPLCAQYFWQHYPSRKTWRESPSTFEKIIVIFKTLHFEVVPVNSSFDFLILYYVVPRFIQFQINLIHFTFTGGQSVMSLY